MQLAVYIKNKKLLSEPRLSEFVEGLRQEGFDVYMLDASVAGTSHIPSSDDLREGTDMILSLGGDGTFLSAAKYAGISGVPLLGVNFGRMGFLSEAVPSEVIESLKSGKYIVESRALLQLKVLNGADCSCEAPIYPYALNEFAVHRSGNSVLGVNISLDGSPLPTYWADGMIVSTPSGSTAYSLSAGGPICSPDAGVLILTPISPHNLNVRPLIVKDTARIELSFECRDAQVLLSGDTRSALVDAGTKLSISLAQFSLGRVRLDRSNFVKALTQKLFWGEDVRNNQ